MKYVMFSLTEKRFSNTKVYDFVEYCIVVNGKFPVNKDYYSYNGAGSYTGGFAVDWMLMLRHRDQNSY